MWIFSREWRKENLANKKNEKKNLNNIRIGPILRFGWVRFSVSVRMEKIYKYKSVEASTHGHIRYLAAVSNGDASLTKLSL